MGRGGRSGGSSGGGKRGGSFGGGRGGAGRKSSGSFNSGKNRGSFSSGLGNKIPSTTNQRPTYRPVPRRQHYSGGYRHRRHHTNYNGIGCMRFIGCFMLIVVIVFIGLAIYFTGMGSTNHVIPSTIEREPLPAGSVNETDYYTDELDWIGNQTTMNKGLRHFYNETGVQPYVYITDNIAGELEPAMSDVKVFANDLYDELFTDEAHLLLLFFENEEGYMTYYVTGSQARSVIDVEAGDILLDYIDRYYYQEGLTDAEYFSLSFQDAADRMMEVTRSPWIDVVMGIVVVLLILILFIWWKRKQQQNNLEAKQTEDILNKPLDTFGDTKAEEIAQKYEEKIDEDNT